MTLYKTCHSSIKCITKFAGTDVYAGSATEADTWEYQPNHLNIRLDGLRKDKIAKTILKVSDPISEGGYFKQSRTNAFQIPAHELFFDWKDGDAIHYDRNNWKEFVKELTTFTMEMGIETMYVHCVGGHGRTGTFLSIILTLLGCYTKKQDPVLALRKAYCESAVETSYQLDYIEEIIERRVTDKLTPFKYTLGTGLKPMTSDGVYWVQGDGYYSDETRLFLAFDYQTALNMAKQNKPAIIYTKKEMDEVAFKAETAGIHALTDKEYEIWQSIP